LLFALRGSFEAGFDALQSFHPFGLEITFSRRAEHRFGRETVLHPQTILYTPFKNPPLLVRHRISIAHLTPL
jgi:hypothetical protein